MGQFRRTVDSMRCLLVLSALIGFSLAADPFLLFARQFGKNYGSTEELSMRREIFLSNYQDMLDHNTAYEAGELSWSRKVTEFYDLTHDELLLARGLGLPYYDESTKFEDIEDPAFMQKLEEVQGKSAPAEWSWVDQGGVSSVKNQAQCGSCAAFATIATIDTCFWIQTGSLFDDLSEQHLMDCANGHFYNDDNGAWGAFGCNGAWPPAYFDWIVNHNGGRLQTESSCPYKAVDKTCRDSNSGDYSSAHVTGQYNIWNSDEEKMKTLVLINPVATSIQASYLSDYDQGVYDDSRCCEQSTDPSCRYNLNHSVNVVGYGHDAQTGKDYWLVKNSWGDWFGENGFFKIKRGTGHCGVGSMDISTAYCAPN